MKQPHKIPAPPTAPISPDAVGEIASPSGEYRAVALRGLDGLFRISVFEYFYDEYIDEAYWSQLTRDSLTDTVETAECLAREELQKFRHRRNFI